MFVWTSIISDAVSRMMVGNSGRFKKGVEKDTRVNVDVVPISLALLKKNIFLFSSFLL